MGSRGSASGAGGGGRVTPTSISSLTESNLQKFVSQFGTGMTTEAMARRVYNALPSTGTSTAMGGVTSDKGATIMNGRYLQTNNGTTYQFIRQQSTGTWVVKKI